MEAQMKNRPLIPHTFVIHSYTKPTKENFNIFPLKNVVNINMFCFWQQYFYFPFCFFNPWGKILKYGLFSATFVTR